MKKKLLVKIAVCILGCSLVSYEHIHGLNELTSMRIEIPQIQQEIAKVTEEIDQLQFECLSMENPQNLLYLAKSAEFSDLQYPLQEEVLVLQKEKMPLVALKEPIQEPFKIHPFKLSVILGAH